MLSVNPIASHMFISAVVGPDLPWLWRVDTMYACSAMPADGRRDYEYRIHEHQEKWQLSLSLIVGV